MRTFRKRVMERAKSLTKETPLCPAGPARLVNRPAMNHALSRLTRSERLMQICHSACTRQIMTRFGLRNPWKYKAMATLLELWDETIVPCGGATTNRLGLTTHNPIRRIYFTPGNDWKQHFERREIVSSHAPGQQLVAPPREAGKHLGRACHHAGVDGGAGKRAPVSWLILNL